MLLINRYWLNIAVLTANLVRAVWIVILIVTFVVLEAPIIMYIYKKFVSQCN